MFSYEVLGLVGSTGAGPHDLRRMVARGRMLDWAGESRYYVEPKRLARLGYLEARKAPGRTRERNVSELTEQGREGRRARASCPTARSTCGSSRASWRACSRCTRSWWTTSSASFLSVRGVGDAEH